MRIRISNEEAFAPLVIEGASVGIASDGCDVLPETLRPVTLSGSARINLPPGSPVGEAAVARFDRDVARISGVCCVIVLEGINDIASAGTSALFGKNPPLDVNDLIAGYEQIIARAHVAGIKVIMPTLTPFGGGTTGRPASGGIHLDLHIRPCERMDCSRRSSSRSFEPCLLAHPIRFG